MSLPALLDSSLMHEHNITNVYKATYSDVLRCRQICSHEVLVHTDTHNHQTWSEYGIICMEYKGSEPSSEYEYSHCKYGNHTHFACSVLKLIPLQSHFMSFTPYTQNDSLYLYSWHCTHTSHYVLILTTWLTSLVLKLMTLHSLFKYVTHKMTHSLLLILMTRY